MKIILVGSGSNGTEYIKNLSLMGVGTANKGNITILDNGKIS